MNDDLDPYDVDPSCYMGAKEIITLVSLVVTFVTATTFVALGVKYLIG